MAIIRFIRWPVSVDLSVALSVVALRMVNAPARPVQVAIDVSAL